MTAESRERPAEREVWGSRVSSINTMPRRIAGLDGLRGIAVISVMAFHWSFPFWNLPNNSAVQRAVYIVFENGSLGVDLFFVLSGFLITGILLRAKGTAHFFRNFYARRSLRIFPLYYTTLMCILVLPAAIGHGLVASSVIEHQAWLWFYGTNLVLDRWNFGDLGHLWSLAVEEHFYLIWPLLVLLLSRKKLAVACGVAVVLAFCLRLVLIGLGAPPTFPIFFTFCRFDSLAIGGLLALVLQRHATATAFRVWAGSLVIVGGIISILLMVSFARFPAHELVLKSIGYPLFAVTFAAMIAVVSGAPEHSAILRILKSRVLSQTGKISYGLYVLHLPMERVASVLGRPLLRRYGQDFFSRSMGGQVSWMGLAMVATFSAAIISWHLLEAPFLRMKRYFPEPR